MRCMVDQSNVYKTYRELFHNFTMEKDVDSGKLIPNSCVGWKAELDFKIVEEATDSRSLAGRKREVILENPASEVN